MGPTCGPRNPSRISTPASATSGNCMASRACRQCRNRPSSGTRNRSKPGVRDRSRTSCAGVVQDRRGREYPLQCSDGIAHPSGHDANCPRRISHPSYWAVQQPEADHEQRQEKSQGTGHPHEDTGRRLILQGGEPSQPRDLEIIRIQDMVGESQQGRQDGVLHVRQDQVRQQQPERPARVAGIRPDDGIPEQQARAQETDVLEIMPAAGAQGEFVSCRRVPEPGGRDKQRQRRRRVGQPRKERPQRRGAQQGRDPVRADRLRKAPQQRQQRRTQPEQRRRGHHEQQVLEHVDLQQQRGERLDRRRQGQVDRRQPAQEGGEPAGVPALRVPPA